MKAQVQTQIFIYILAAIVAGTVLLVGYSTISTITKNQEAAKLTMFESGFSNAVGEVASEYGRERQYTISLPSSYSMICIASSLVGSEYSSQVKTAAESSAAPAAFKAGIRRDAEENIFIFSNKIEKYKFTVPDLKVNDGGSEVVCLKNEGKLTVWLEGTGKSTVLRP